MDTSRLARVNAFEIVFRVIDLTGVLLNGVLGGKMARESRFDVVGFMVLALMSALGGGVVCDLMLHEGPPVAITDPFYIGTALLGATIAYLWKLSGKFWRVTLMVADGVVLGCWAATGAVKTLSAGFGVVPAILLGTITAVGGSMIRDICAGRVPSVFERNNLYATPALLSAVIMVAMYHLDQLTWGMIAATGFGSAFTAVSHWRHWHSPRTPELTLRLRPGQPVARHRYEVTAPKHKHKVN